MTNGLTVPLPREGHRRTFGEPDKRRIVDATCGPAPPCRRSRLDDLLPWNWCPSTALNRHRVSEMNAYAPPCSPDRALKMPQTPQSPRGLAPPLAVSPPPPWRDVVRGRVAGGQIDFHFTGDGAAPIGVGLFSGRKVKDAWRQLTQMKSGH
jgi:hypothetical protein